MFDFSHRRNGYFLGLAIPLLFISLQMCVDLDARPESEKNPAGREHTVVADVEAGGNESWALLFEVISGPNQGQNSLCESDDFEPCESDIEECLLSLPNDEEDLDECLAEATCDPGCVGSGDETVTWTYESNGKSGTDVIAVCGTVFSIETRSLGVSISQILPLPDEDLDELIEELEDAGCDIVLKEWVDDDEDEDDEGPPPNVGGIFAGDLDAAQRNRERARASVAPATAPPPAAAAPIRPPSTGDAGLRD
jgi:hypothetical protein